MKKRLNRPFLEGKVIAGIVHELRFPNANFFEDPETKNSPPVAGQQAASGGLESIGGRWGGIKRGQPPAAWEIGGWSGRGIKRGQPGGESELSLQQSYVH